MPGSNLMTQGELKAQFARLTRSKMEQAKAALREAGVAPTGQPMLVQVAPGQWTISFMVGLGLMEALPPEERAQAERMLAAEPERPEPPEEKAEAQHDE